MKNLWIERDSIKKETWYISDSYVSTAVSHGGLAIYIKKYLKANEELWKLKYFTMQKHNLQKIL
jgi:hypothetical protein